MKKTIIIRDDKLKAQAAAAINALPVEPLHEIRIVEHKKNRSLDQNTLYWKWLTIIAGEIGMTKDELHLDCKKRILVPILLEHSEEDGEGFAEMWESIREVWRQGMKPEAEQLKNQVVKMVSTSKLKVKRMAQYITEIEREANGLGIWLPRPEDRL